MVGVHMKMTTIKQSSRYNGGHDSAAMTDYISGHQNGGQILPVAVSLLGTIVKVQTKENKLFEGVFKAFSPQYEFALEVVHQLELGREDELPRKGNVTDKMIFKLEDIVKIEGTPDLESVVKGGFATDAEISRANNGSLDATRDLEPWEPDIGTEDDHFGAENNGPLGDGWSVEEMFSVNQERFAIQSDYDEKLYHTSAHQEIARRAHEIAREIERNPASKRAAELENDDEERDIVVKSSGSSANNSTATTPTSATASGAATSYIPPNKRTGGDRGNRGNRRGGSGPQYQGGTMRGQGSGDGRGQVRGPPRDYMDPSAHPLNTGYFTQPPRNRFAPQHHHHQMVAQTSHERVPTGPGANNEWERARVPKRQDVRDNHSSGPFQLPQQMPPSSHNHPTRPLPVLPQRPTMDSTASSGTKRTKTVEELKKFSNDFRLTSEAQGGMAPGISGPSPVTGTASSSNQPSRMPPQTSPTQSHMPPPLSMPQPQQRRSPELKAQPSANYVMGGHQTGPPPHPPPHHLHHPNQNQAKLPPQISPGQAQLPSLPPPMIRPEVPPRMLNAGEAMYQQQQLQQTPHPAMSQQHSAPDYSIQPHIHQQPQRPNHPSMMVMQGGNGGGPQASKMHQVSGHMPSQMQPMVVSHPPPSQPQLSQPPPSQTPQHEQDQRGNESSTEAIKKSKLNPDAAEFRPQQFRPSSAAPPQMVVPAVSNTGVVSYPMQVQSPPQTPIMQQNPMSSNVYGSVQTGAAMANPAMYVGAAQAAYPLQHPHSSMPMSVQLVGAAAPMYTLQTNPQTVLMSNPNNPTLRPRAAAVVAPPQQAVAAATGQPIMAAGPYPQQTSYVSYNAGQTVQSLPAGPAGAAYSQNQAYVVSAPRMLPPQYVMPQGPGNPESSQQQYYATATPVIQVAPGTYPQAAPGLSAMHHPVPASQYNQQQQNSGNSGHSQTPPTSQQQSQVGNPASASGLPPPQNVGNVSGAGTMNAAPAMPYPPSAPTPQSPPYQTAPAGPAGYPGQYVAVFPGSYMTATPGAPHLYSGPGGVAPGAVHIQNAAAVHQPYPTGQAHFVAPEYAYAAMAAAQQAATVHHISHAASNTFHHPTVLRSSSVTTPYAPGGPVVSAAAGQGASSVSHQNNHS